MSLIEENYDVIVVGAGHAGVEAALASARMGMETLIFTLSPDAISMMACNPNIGGSSKGHLVRELDALGGEMGKVCDRSFIQSRMLNKSKGPAVHSLRAQADKQLYSQNMREVLENQERVHIRQGEVVSILTDEEKKEVRGVESSTGARYLAKAVIICTGVYLNARCIYGEVSEKTGPNGLRRAEKLSDSLRELGFPLLRFKTGTPARVDRRSLDFSQMEVQKGDVPVVPFSFSTDPVSVQIEQDDCFLTYTNEEGHSLIRKNIHRAPMYNGSIEGTGPRYCPSIEDKVMKFPDKDRHQIFVEPEGRYTNEMYLSGLSSSLPEDVQIAILHTMPGFQKAEMVRHAYAIEYDCLNSLELKNNLETKRIAGLFFAGQMNGSSGYEEAAVQGFMAGVNAVKHLRGEEAFVLDRSEAYIGVLIDDLVTKENKEPYRMMTSRAEYRLLLRQDNADLRLREKGYRLGLISEEEIRKTREKRESIQKEVERMGNTYVGANEKNNAVLSRLGSSPIQSGISLLELCKRPECSYKNLEELDPERPFLSAFICEEVEIEIKYEGYIKRQIQQVEAFKKLERKKLPKEIDYQNMQNLRLEARQKLDKIRPENIGMASRISGVSPADISVLLVYLEKHRKE
ncbi:tRNA uridine-5-carboxymethylaminomethyl(34) synthesis enzyme MnmG [Oribacterium parvum]|uniref:tRNA uridine-5-carboxymethylaminomethyl(34) synthesis enzyme MnmG n=1 Tax=Oribacterium parvum TaxID=1501329 RepID=UPI0028DC9184|nr:tRNA uridine-5-carboxymethylaminomethyl(34) synthesis enzyme MnmG [Oribacterium parvum]